MQLDALSEAGCDEVFQERASGTRDDRPVLGDLLSRLAPGDAVVVWRLDRLARSTRHLIELSDRFSRDGVDLVSLRESIDTSTASGRMYFGVMAVLAQFEADMTRERTRAGVRAARARGARVGRPAKDDAFTTATMLVSSGATVSEACRRAGISRSTYYTHGGSARPSAIGGRDERG